MSDDNTDLDDYQKYIDTFGVTPPMPICVDESEALKQVRVALEKGKPIPNNYDWYNNLPLGAVP